jgi:hypothetical protein
VRLCRRLIAISFHQNESGRIIDLLNYIESCNARFLDAIPGIFNGGIDESRHGLRFHLYVDMNDEHTGSLNAIALCRKRTGRGFTTEARRKGGSKNAEGRSTSAYLRNMCL